MRVHKDLRIAFEVDGRRYEAVGFLNEGEGSVPGEEMLRRTAAENGGAIGDDDREFLRERIGKLPKELRNYCLVTNMEDADYPGSISYFRCYVDKWEMKWFRPRPWISSDLVLRRLP